MTLSELLPQLALISSAMEGILFSPLSVLCLTSVLVYLNFLRIFNVTSMFVFHFLHILRPRVVQLRSPFFWDLVPHGRMIGA